MLHRPMTLLSKRGIMTYQLEAVRKAFENKKAELLNAIRAHTSQLSIGAEHELLDRMQVMYNRDQAVTLIDVMTRTLADVKAALIATDDGSYGICVECREDIAPKRL